MEKDEIKEIIGGVCLLLFIIWFIIISGFYY